MILVFWVFSFKPTFSLSSFTHIKRLFISSSLFAIRVASFAYLRLLIFLLAVLIPVCGSSSLAFHMMYSAYSLSHQGSPKLNKQGGNIQSCPTPFPNFQPFSCSMSSYNCSFWHTYMFLRRQVKLSSIHVALRIFHKCLDPHKVFSIVNEAEVDVDVFFWNSFAFAMIQGILEIRSLVILFLWNPITSGSSQVTHILLKPSLKELKKKKDTIMLNVHSCNVVWKLFALLWDWNENWPFPVLWPLVSFPNLLTYWVQHFNNIIF